MSHIGDLVQEQANVGKKLLRLMVVKNIHIHSLGSTVGECTRIVLLIDEITYAGDNHSSWEDSLEITTRHLENKTHVGGNGGYETGTSLYAAASLVLLGVIGRDFKIYIMLRWVAQVI